jgi:NAD(P)-dependent dehydrogenase (short-subunit alcohol dehydrogenase family)
MAELSRSFSMEDQQWFSSVSGDCNPLHVDPEFAARTYPGFPVVHGLHLVLWALNAWAQNSAVTIPKGMKVNFVRPVIVGDLVSVDLSKPDVIRLCVRGEMMATIRFKTILSPSQWHEQCGPTSPSNPPMDRRSGKDLDTVSGRLMLPEDGIEIAGAFPAIAAMLNEKILRGLSGISTIIGMETPGLYSLLSEFSVAFDSDHSEATMAYWTLSYHDVFSRVELAFSGLGVTGRVAAMAGREDPLTFSDADLSRFVTADEYHGHQPLIIGASSGLGQITAILLAAAGARPLLSYTRTPATLTDTIAKVENIGGEYDIVKINMNDLDSIPQVLSGSDWVGDTVYYFASPRIFRRRIEPFQADDFAEFNYFFVTAFYELTRHLITHRNGGSLRIFYPSSSAIDENLSELLEYSLAKSAGEKLCSAIEAKHKNVEIPVIRFARIATRQTNAALQVEAASAVEQMASVIRIMQAKE